MATMTKDIKAIAEQVGITEDQVADILRSADGGTVTPRLLHDHDAIAKRRAELAAERAAGPRLDNEYLRGLLREIHEQ